MFCIEGRTTTSEEEAIEAIAQHIENIYKEPTHPINIPPWNPNHGVGIDSIEKAVGLAVFPAKKGQSIGYLWIIECVYQKPRRMGQ